MLRTTVTKGKKYIENNSVTSEAHLIFYVINHRFHARNLDVLFNILSGGKSGKH